MITIDASFSRAAQDKLNELKLDDYKPPADNMQNNNSGNPGPEINNTQDFLAQLNDLKLDNNEQNMYDELQENKIKKEAENRLSQFKQSSLDPFKSGWQQSTNNQPANNTNIDTSGKQDTTMNPFANAPQNDKTFQDVKLNSFAQQKGTPDPSFNFGNNAPVGKQMSQAPQKLPVEFSYNKLMVFNRQQYDYNLRKF